MMAQAPAPREGVQRSACAGLSQAEAGRVARRSAGVAPPASASHTREELCHTSAARAFSAPPPLAAQLLALSSGTPVAALCGAPLKTPMRATPQPAPGEATPGADASPAPSPGEAACSV